MDMIKVLFIFVLIIGSSLAIDSSAKIARDVPTDLLPQAEVILREFLVAEGAIPVVGGRNTIEKRIIRSDEISSFHLGVPFPVWKMVLERIEDVEDQAEFESCLVFLCWAIPVYYNHEPQALLNIVREDDKWRLYSFGGDPSYIIRARSKWPSSEGYRYADILAYPHGVGPNFMLLERNNQREVYSYREGYEEYLNISKGSDGDYPLIPLSQLIERCKLKETERTKLRQH
jgi:hypothetical protein